MLRKLLVLLILAVPLSAADDPSFFLERIEVRNHHRVSPDVVLAESRLHEGRVYTEAELRDAATRLSRLPFLLSVDFSLEKGSERGNYVLVLTVNETKPFFYRLDLVPYLSEVERPVDPDYQDRPASSGGNELGLGFRWFVGRRGAVHVGFALTREDRAFTREYAAGSVGYTQYDLFGTRAFLTLNLKRPLEGTETGLLSPQVVLGVPLSSNQTMTLEVEDSRFEAAKSDESVLGTSYEVQQNQRTVTARWTYNTSNDPFFPTEGTVLSLTPYYTLADGVDGLYSGDLSLDSGAFHSRSYGLVAGTTRYHELSERNSVWGDVRGEWARIERDSDFLERSYEHTATSASVGVGYGFSLWTRDERASGDSRFEWTARYTNRANREERIFYSDHDDDVIQIAWAWIRRSSFGTLRLGVGYAR